MIKQADNGDEDVAFIQLSAEQNAKLVIVAEDCSQVVEQILKVLENGPNFLNAASDEEIPNIFYLEKAIAGLLNDIDMLSKVLKFNRKRMQFHKDMKFFSYYEDN